MTIAIDGHVGSGKSTLAKGLAERLGLKVLDTGAIYRTMACAFKELFGENITSENIEKFAKNAKIEIKFDSGRQIVYANGKDYSAFIRLEETSVFVAKISGYPELRALVLNLQRDFAAKNNCIMEGRDIGTIVLPNADIKFFVTAKDTIRAQRRYDQMKGSATFEEVLSDLRARDYADEHRPVAPLKTAPDSIIIDNTDLNLTETIDLCEKIVREKLEI